MEDVNFRHLSSGIMDIGIFLFSPVIMPTLGPPPVSDMAKVADSHT